MFRNNKYGFYTDSYRMDDTANQAALMRCAFENNEYGLYIASLCKNGFEYNVKYCRFVDNDCDLYYGFTHKVFFPCNYFGKTEQDQLVARDPIVEGRQTTVVKDKWKTPSGTQYTYADIKTDDLVTLDPILLDPEIPQQGGKVRLGVSAGTGSFQMLNKQASTLPISSVSLINRAFVLAINMVDQNTTPPSENNDDPAPSVVGATTIIGIWNIAAK